MAIVLIALVLIAYALFHHHHYRRRRRAGLTIRESLPGPFGTRISVSKRL